MADFDTAHHHFFQLLISVSEMQSCDNDLYYTESGVTAQAFFFQGIMDGFDMNSLLLGLVSEKVITTK